MKNFRIDFVSARKGFFTDTLNAFGKNAEHVFIINKNTRCKTIPPAVHPHVFFFDAVAYEHERGRRFVNRFDDGRFRIFRIITDIAPDNLQIRPEPGASIES